MRACGKAKLWPIYILIPRKCIPASAPKYLNFWILNLGNAFNENSKETFSCNFFIEKYQLCDIISSLTDIVNSFTQLNVNRLNHFLIFRFFFISYLFVCHFFILLLSCLIIPFPVKRCQKIWNKKLSFSRNIKFFSLVFQCALRRLKSWL